eukprot:CAMPEP_0118861574 /NCGR_PEP_ID=MMETSP1163-20130328/7065_1 /TAXON_ID=124430 /ORGANISM="Phaeomonas parva, Strain CCMP2877" /LENGTH=53 /DNA_ID=CAMNT_0006795399 /DNA_START=132 /DNA_END=290 /DNA_ORIENTATION=-
MTNSSMTQDCMTRTRVTRQSVGSSSFVMASISESSCVAFCMRIQRLPPDIRLL